MSEFFEVTAAEAADKGLPAVGVRLDLAGAGLHAAGPVADAYARMSGPPGGPLLFQILALGAAPSLEALDACIRQVHADAEPAESEALTAAGHPAIGRMFYAGQGHPLTAMACFALALKDVPGGDDSLVLLGGKPGKPGRYKGLAELLASIPFAGLLDSLEITG